MTTPIRFEALNDKTFEPTTDPRQLSASRAMALLVACEITAEVLVKQGSRYEPGVATAAMQKLVLSLLQAHEDGLRHDIDTLAGMLGCRLVRLDPNAKGGTC